MLHLKLSFGKNSGDQRLPIKDNEILSDAISRALENVPLGKFEIHESFNVTVNGLLIDKDFWKLTKLSETDTVAISPKIKGGDSGQIFKQVVVLAVALYAGPQFALAFGQGTVAAALATAAVTLGAALIMNGLIPPPIQGLGEDGSAGDLNNSQMYSFSGQSNKLHRLGTVPKVYGNHRIFPGIAALPYTELAVDPETGETIQYLYAIYDFGLGVMKVSELKIGDTPLDTDSFEDFHYRLVDPMKPEVDEDEYDEALDGEFIYYKGRRASTPLSIALNETNDESTQVLDANTSSLAQEIILDFIAPSGLYGYSSNGVKSYRTVTLDVKFALNGTSDWRSFNDLNYVDSHSEVGALAEVDFKIKLPDPGVDSSTYYVQSSTVWGGYWGGGFNYTEYYNIKPNINTMLISDDARVTVGAKVFYGDRFLGIINNVNNIGGANTIITLDRIITTKSDIVGYTRHGRANSAGGISNLQPPAAMAEFRISVSSNSEAIIKGDKTSAVYAQVRFSPKVVGQYKVKVRRVSATGPYAATRTNQDGTVEELFADDITWTGVTSAYIGASTIESPKRHCFLELKIRATNQINGNIQNLSGIVSSVIPVYDPDTEIWTRQPTSNPAWVFCDLLTGEVNKKAVANTRLDMASIVEWADYCDEVPTPPPGATYYSNRFQCNFILDYESTLQEVLGQICGAAQASMTIIDGKYGILIDRARTTPVQIFTPRNSSGFSSSRLYGPRPHGLRVKFIDPNLDWEISEVTIYDTGYSAANAIEFDELSAFACTSQEQAWRFGRYMLAQNKLRQETISLLVDFENLVCTRGDYVQISQDVMRVGGTPARVKSVSGINIEIDDSLDIDGLLSYGYTFRSATGEILTSTLTPVSPNSFDLDGDMPAVGDLIIIGEIGSITYDCIVKSISPNDDMSANLILVERANEIFDYESTGVLPDYDPQISNTSNPDIRPPLAVIDLEYTDNFWECSDLKSGYSYYIELNWNMPPGSVFELFEIWVNDSSGYKRYDTTTSKIYKYPVEQSKLDIEHGFKVVAVSASGKKLNLIEMAEVLVTPVTKTSAPSDVEFFDIGITDQVIQLTWQKIMDCDCASYAIRYSPEVNDVWEQSIPLSVVNRDVNLISIQGRTGVYMIKAIDFNGNQSANAARVVTTIPELFDLNVVDTIDDAPTFNGTKIQTELLGEAVILSEEVPGNIDTVKYFFEGFYEYANLLDLGEVFSVRLQSRIRADGLKKGELMSEWTTLTSVSNLNSALHSDWNVGLQYRATDTFASMADWDHLNEIDHLNYGAGVGFTDWRDISTLGDVTGRVFQFRAKLQSLSPNVTPRVFDTTVQADMPDRIDSFENLTSHASLATTVTYSPVFKGPGTTPNVQISIDNAQTGDYWVFGSKTLSGFTIRFYDKNGTQVVRQFDVVAKGYGRRYTVTI